MTYAEHYRVHYEDATGQRFASEQVYGYAHALLAMSYLRRDGFFPVALVRENPRARTAGVGSQYAPPEWTRR